MTAGGKAHRLIVGLALTAGGLTACGSGSQLVVRPPATSASASASPSPTTSVTINPQVTVRPSRHLHEGQIVHVDARGFGPNQSLITIECVDLGKKTGQGSCNIAGLSAISVGPDGTGSAGFKVTKGPFGSDNLSCTARHPCIVSVSQATISPTQTASATIEFG